MGPLLIPFGIGRGGFFPGPPECRSPGAAGGRSPLPRRGPGLAGPLRRSRSAAAPGPGARKTKGERRKGQAPLGINLGQRATIFAGLYANASEPRRQCIGGAGTGPRL